MSFTKRLLDGYDDPRSVLAIQRWSMNLIVLALIASVTLLLFPAAIAPAHVVLFTFLINGLLVIKAKPQPSSVALTSRLRAMEASLATWALGRYFFQSGWIYPAMIAVYFAVVVTVRKRMARV